MLRFIVILSLALFACDPPCNPRNCFGCCQGDMCVSGKTAEACGSKGEVCSVCGAGQECLSAMCFDVPEYDGGLPDAGPPCPCEGSCCMEDGGCAAGNDATACGAAKRWCAPCGEDQRCENGACVSLSCGGCFDPLGTCRAGNASDACGAAGGLCQVCGADQACESGACVYTKCDADNCRFGCCMPDKRCETAVSSSACGTEGAPCEACEAVESCVAGLCQP